MDDDVLAQYIFLFTHDIWAVCAYKYHCIYIIIVISYFAIVVQVCFLLQAIVVNPWQREKGRHGIDN